MMPSIVVILYDYPKTFVQIQRNVNSSFGQLLNIKCNCGVFFPSCQVFPAFWQNGSRAISLFPIIQFRKQPFGIKIQLCRPANANGHVRQFLSIPLWDATLFRDGPSQLKTYSVQLER